MVIYYSRLYIFAARYTRIKQVKKISIQQTSKENRISRYQPKQVKMISAHHLSIISSSQTQGYHEASLLVWIRWQRCRWGRLWRWRGRRRMWRGRWRERWWCWFLCYSKSCFFFFLLELNICWIFVEYLERREITASLAFSNQSLSASFGQILLSEDDDAFVQS